MSSDYFYTLPPQLPVVGYEYKKNTDLQAQGYFALANTETILTVPEHSRDLVNQLINLDSTDVILEYDLDQVVDNQLATPAVFKVLMPNNTHAVANIMWQLSGLDAYPLPDLPAGTRYTHMGAFINRLNSGLRLNIGGGGHYVKEFILQNGGDAYWFDQFEHHSLSYMASCDFVAGQVLNLRLEIHRRYDLFEVPELLNDPWVQSALAHCEENINKNYSNDLPKIIISHYKVGANTQDIANNYMKMYTQAQWK